MLDKQLPPNLVIENHECGHQVGVTTHDMRRTFYDLDTKEPVTHCPGCGDELTAHSRFQKADTTVHH
jgi:hypothetical protein